MCYLLQGIRIIQSNTSFLLLKYTYIQDYMFQLRGVIVNIHYFNLLQYTEIHFNPNNFNLTVHSRQYTSAL
jgi:hypothetical protein